MKPERIDNRSYARWSADLAGALERHDERAVRHNLTPAEDRAAAQDVADGFDRELVAEAMQAREAHGESSLTERERNALRRWEESQNRRQFGRPGESPA